MNSGNSRRFADGLTYTRFVLMASSAVLVLYGVFIFLSFPFRLKSQEADAASLFSSESLFSDGAEARKAADFTSHGLFYYPKAEVAATGPGLDEILRPFHLIGIIQGDRPEALLRNDLNQQTYFARAGENFEKFHVKEILAGSIKVEFENQIKEIYLEEGVS